MPIDHHIASTIHAVAMLGTAPGAYNNQLTSYWMQGHWIYSGQAVEWMRGKQGGSEGGEMIMACGIVLMP